jgi:benzoyl-CoA reductase/2-hydroxyglutaryl-CoA dehydratase subunit BcrC/BadD/HgdB
MKTAEIVLASAERRLEEVALTEEQFKKWPSAKRSQYIKDHPNSKFAQNKGNRSGFFKDTKNPVSKKSADTRNAGRDSLKKTISDANKDIKAYRKIVEHWEFEVNPRSNEDEKENAKNHIAFYKGKIKEALKKKSAAIQKLHKMGQSQYGK